MKVFFLLRHSFSATPRHGRSDVTSHCLSSDRLTLALTLRGWPLLSYLDCSCTNTALIRGRPRDVSLVASSCQFEILTAGGESTHLAVVRGCRHEGRVSTTGLNHSTKRISARADHDPPSKEKSGTADPKAGSQIRETLVPLHRFFFFDPSAAFSICFPLFHLGAPLAELKQLHVTIRPPSAPPQRSQRRSSWRRMTFARMR